MKINRLRLLGFKSFVEPTELVIEEGLTGVVGPNGCGKSNLLEALRWVMGETSHKSMRAAAMDDVIFAGTVSRPPRNLAEVTVFLDNRQRSAPAQFNDAEVIEITRRIEREAGSAYRINGQEVRARDVRILFEDAATGARSPALVRQGQIAEIVNAKPELRRRILEDAAGVAGLHSRRHDAELRLKAAEANLARLADVMGSLAAQIEGLKRQARQARRYKELSADIRKAEAVAAYLAWSAASADLEAGKAGLADALTRLGAAVEAESRATRFEAELAERIQPLREAEAVRGAVLARLQIEQGNFEREAERVESRRRELAARVNQLDQDIAREETAAREAREVLARVDDELESLVAAEEGAQAAASQAEAALAECRTREAEAQRRTSDLTRQDFEIRAQRKTLEAKLVERREAAQKLERQVAALKQQLADLIARTPDADQLADRQAALEELAHAIEDAEVRAAIAEQRITEAAAAAKASREAVQRAGLDLRGVETEHATLARILRPRAGDGHAPVLDSIAVAPGYEVALGAALGDDLDAPLAADDEEAEPALLHWRRVDPHSGDASLPVGVESLAGKVEAPPELARRLAQIGVVERADGARLQHLLAPGQRLVSRQGDLWRWDGFVATAEAPTAAAERLAQKNRLVEIDRWLAELQLAATGAAESDEEARAALSASEAESRAVRQAVREMQAQFARTRDDLVRMEQASREVATRRLAIEEACEQACDALMEAHESVAETELALELCAETTGLEDDLASAHHELEDLRREAARLAGEAGALERECRLRADRLVAARADRQRWSTRADSAAHHMVTLAARRDEAKAELDEIGDLPARLEESRQRLMSEVAAAEHQRSAAADELAAAEAALRSAQQDLRAAQGEVSAEREARARVEERLLAARTRLEAEEHRIRETFQCEPDACLALARFPEDCELPARDDIERQIGRMKADRDRLGGVNLAADQELETIGAQYESLEKEHLDVEEAIAKLRGAIGQLNREGKKRIDEAFEAVNAHFQELFTTLFNGGEARLEMIEGEDPLEGGLEIVAKPPGKKPATLSLLSGGEQSLTALSLIFAVFLTNPSPICVLDEVDAPLDDANVDRFCKMMEKMAADTDTRFLVITHHPMTMARMHRLFGVTMGEKGVSQLVSVDLATAESIIETEPRRAAG